MCVSNFRSFRLLWLFGAEMFHARENCFFLGEKFRCVDVKSEYFLNRMLHLLIILVVVVVCSTIFTHSTRARSRFDSIKLFGT